MKAKTSKVLKKILIAVISIIVILGLAVGAFFLFYTPTVTFDAADLTGEVTSGASGYLYGIAEDGVPSYEMAQSLDISSISTKTENGLQHPIAEVGDVAEEVLSDGTCDYIVVYLQDMFSTWYYENDTITAMKEEGTYDWQEFIENEFFPLVEETVNEIKDSDYADKIVYCLYNECDNGVWFGETTENLFDDTGKANFYEAWKLTYDYVKSLDENAVIGGPGYYEYDAEKLEGFLAYTTENDCAPDVIIYHELAYRSIYDWTYNVDELREIEETYGLSSETTPIIVTEYGQMEENGDPNAMVKYIAQIENSKVYANQAYWLVANNFCNTSADDNTPNSAWWVYRWYAEMEGETMQVSVSDVLHSDVGKAISEKRGLRYREFLGVGALDDDNATVDILVSGADYDGKVKVENLDETNLYGQTVEVTVTAVTYQGISGEVYEPEIVKTYTTTCDKTLTVDMDDMNGTTAYHIEITLADEEHDEYVNDNLYVRYEFEEGTLLGSAYTYDSAYATTGDTVGMVGGMENEGDGVEIEITVDEDATYELVFICGNSNDGEYDEDGLQDSDDRVNSIVNLSIDDDETLFSVPNTIKSEFTTSETWEVDLTAGTHTITITHNEGTIVLDSLLVRKAETEETSLQILDDGDGAYFVVSTADGYYQITTDEAAEVTVGIDKNVTATADEDGYVTAYLKRGLNYITSTAEITSCYSVDDTSSTIDIDVTELTVSGSAEIVTDDETSEPYLDGITSDGGSATAVVEVEEAGYYALTLLYANNDENGVHDYNIDLVEDYVSISVNGDFQKELYCRNTYSWQTYKTVTTEIYLEAGENYIYFENDGSNLFNNTTANAPRIMLIQVSPFIVE